MRSRRDEHVVSAGTSYTTNDASEKKVGGILGFGFRRPTSTNVVKTLDFPVFASNPVRFPLFFLFSLVNICKHIRRSSFSTDGVDRNRSDVQTRAIDAAQRRGMLNGHCSLRRARCLIQSIALYGVRGCERSGINQTLFLEL